MASDFSLESLLKSHYEEDFADPKLCEEVILQIFRERSLSFLTNALQKMTYAFYLAEQEYRKNIINLLFANTKTMELESLENLCANTVIGNILLLHHLLERYPVVNNDNAIKILSLAAMKYFKDSSVLKLYPFGSRFHLDIDEHIKDLYDNNTLTRILDIIEILYLNGMIYFKRDSIISLLNLYKTSTHALYKLKSEVIDSLLNCKVEIFIAHISKFVKDIKTKLDIQRNYVKIYDEMHRLGIPVYFTIKNIRFNDIVFNDNFYFMLYENKEGLQELICPYEQTEADQVQKIFDIEIEDFVVPKGRYGKLLLEEIHSFAFVKRIKKASDEELKLVRSLRESEIEQKLRSILKDLNITADSPAEEADILTLKLFVNNENDLRNAAFILKGRGYPKVSLNDVSTNLLKATDLPVDITFFVYTGDIQDEPLKYLIKLCDLNRKMYCVMDRMDLARLLIAYDVLGA